ncbi:MAG: FABP family protein, partial [Brachybacterium sp.]|nr:FABP family protein [Brachybacterium sp.]
MPITLDTSLPPSLYPLAWLIGSWEGTGALSTADPDAPDARIEQQLVCTAREDGTMEWRST